MEDSPNTAIFETDNAAENAESCTDAPCDGIIEAIIALAREEGFECVGTVSTDELVVHEEVRSMCAANRCGHYDSNWACPPACGPVDELYAEIMRRPTTIVVQTVGELEDDFDFFNMMEAGEKHNARFHVLADRIRELYQETADAVLEPYFLGAGHCTYCDECTYPDAPCRCPEHSFVSLDAPGFIVAEMCKAAGILYNHGSMTISYTSAVFV